MLAIGLTLVIVGVVSLALAFVVFFVLSLRGQFRYGEWGQCGTLEQRGERTAGGLNETSKLIATTRTGRLFQWLVLLGLSGLIVGSMLCFTSLIADNT
ncbi:hypothetical protein [Antarctobacter heliothermus]|uniref:Uncharacterized protein n=1 Tax=Antarctobacter heliothermus TaxID=74033 RepID=A0A239H9Q5_9RHOB|nr:hypothetical protein [Antarctobacter heliothermus]SNS78002.1 hypothetical protein SAMN04488078_103212 [Antarctobacter heliothermus]